MADRNQVAQALLSNYTPSWREQIGNSIYDVARALMPSTANRMRDEAMMAVDFIPGVGEAVGLNDAYNDFNAGNYGLAAAGLGLTAAGAIPGVGDAAATGVKKGIRAFHGSPHSFDRFSMDKIGTGEGNQVYGHGLYFAESEDVAKDYRNKLSRNHGLYKAEVDGVANKNVRDLIARSSPEYDKIEDLADTLERRISMSKSDIVIGGGTWPKSTARRALELIRGGGVSVKHPGSMYEVNIKADPDDFLDWDAPLSEQGDKINELVGSRLEQFLDMDGAQIQAPYDRFISGQTTGEEAYRLMHPQSGVDKVDFSRGLSEQASQRLRDSGFAGIKYLDEGSRGLWNIHNPGTGKWGADNAATGAVKEFATREEAKNFVDSQGTRNYVVFDDRLIEIVRKYGLAGAVAAGLISQEMAAQMQAQGIEEL